MEVKLSDGKVVILRKPNAGVRNQAYELAEVPYTFEENGEKVTKTIIKQTKFLVELLPYCIASHDWGTIPVRDALKNLSYEDYDLLIDALQTLTKTDDSKKKD